MPLYDLCALCEIVPVQKPGDKCEDCEKKIREQQKKIDRTYYGELKAINQSQRKGHKRHHWVPK